MTEELLNLFNCMSLVDQKAAGGVAEVMKANVRKIVHERFVRVAVKRVNQILTDMDKHGNCASKISYDYTDTEVAQILSALEAGLEELETKFTDSKRILFHL